MVFPKTKRKKRVSGAFGDVARDIGEGPPVRGGGPVSGALGSLRGPRRCQRSMATPWPRPHVLTSWLVVGGITCPRQQRALVTSFE